MTYPSSSSSAADLADYVSRPAALTIANHYVAEEGEGGQGGPLARFARFNYVRATQLRRGRLIAATSLPIDIDLNLDPISFSLPFATVF